MPSLINLVLFCLKLVFNTLVEQISNHLRKISVNGKVGNWILSSDNKLVFLVNIIESG